LQKWDALELIFLDLVMPNTNGYELCSFLRKSSTFENTPIVILTGHDGVVDRVRAMMAGSSDFMSKPPEADKVLQVVRKYLADESEESGDHSFNYSNMTMGPI
jgi:chemotaxis family two-component system response regulator PixG